MEKAGYAKDRTGKMSWISVMKMKTGAWWLVETGKMSTGSWFGAPVAYGDGCR